MTPDTFVRYWHLCSVPIREYARLRKISGGPRSDTGRRCRDTFLSLNKTCRKLGVSFQSYLRDRLRGTGEIPLRDGNLGTEYFFLGGLPVEAIAVALGLGLPLYFIARYCDSASGESRSV